MQEKHIYFDNASTTIVFDNLISQFYSLERKLFANSSSVHEAGKLALSEIENSRRIIADIFKTKADNIYFVSGATEANNTIINGAIKIGIKTVITSHLEHHSVTEPLNYLKKIKAINLQYVNNDSCGKIDYAHLEQLLTKYKNDKCLVCIMHANNEIGTLNDIELIARLCKQTNALFHSDIVQTAGYYDISPEKLKIDFMSFSSHKFHGPKNAGVMYIDSNTKIDSLIKGGMQEMGMRAGTQSASIISLMTQALEEIYYNKAKYNSHLSYIYNYCLNSLRSQMQNVSVNGNSSDSLHKILNLSFEGKQTTESLLINLDSHSIYASAGSACMSGAVQESSVLKAINYNPNNANIRISFSINNTTAEIDRFIKIIKNIYNEV